MANLDLVAVCPAVPNFAHAGLVLLQWEGQTWASVNEVGAVGA